MYILGLHFGHDSSISILKNGKIIYTLELERLNKKRHTIGINYKDIIFVLKKNNINVKDISYCGVTSTQSIEYIFSKPKKFSFEISKKRFEEEKKINYLNNQTIKNFKKPYLINLFKNRKFHPYLGSLNVNLKNSKFIGSIEDFYTNKKWKVGSSIKNLEKVFLKNIDLRKLSQSMQLPINLKIKNHKIKGWIFSHHYAHASYSYYQSSFNNSLIYTNDGSLPRKGYWSGMIYYGKENNLYPLLPHFLSVGRLYQEVSRSIGFGLHDGPGKMMGLASYGKPTFFDKKFLCNEYEIKGLKIKPLNNKVKKYLDKFKLSKFDIFTKKWLTHILNKSYKKKIDISKIGNLNFILDSVNTNIASSTQKLLEEIQLLVLKKAKKIFYNNNFKTSNLCISGGTALNCPANSKIYNSKIFKKIFVPPAVHDGGLSAGSALSIYYNILQKKIDFKNFQKNNLAYLGNKIDLNDLKKIKKKNRSKIIIIKKKNIFRESALLLSQNKKIAIVFGQSEIGPRALGHRSILAHPGYHDNWKIVNRIKKREPWRPFAPCVLEKFSKKYFKNVPSNSPYMLFNAKVITDTIPAVTHVDLTSRIQTVNKTNSKEIYKILSYFYKFTKLPVLLNTSFNGPGQPIIDDLNDAINLLLSSELDFLVFENYLIKKNLKIN